MIHKTYTNITLVQGFSTMILNVIGESDEANRFFELVAANTLRDHKYNIPTFLDSPLIGTFSSIRAVANLSKINPIYGEIFKRENSQLSPSQFNVPFTTNSSITASKFDGNTILFLASCENSDWRISIQNIIGCYANEFPNLTFYISYKNGGLYDRYFNHRIPITHLISQEFYRGEVPANCCNAEASRTGYYTNDLVRYRMYTAKVLPAKIKCVDDTYRIFTPLTDKHIDTFLL